MKYLSVAKWEFFEKVKSKAFIISLVVMPVIMVGFAFISPLLMRKEDDKPLKIGVIDGTNGVVQPLAKKLDAKYQLKGNQPNYILQNIGEAGTIEERKSRANKLVIDGTLDGYFFIPPTLYDSGKVEYRAENVGTINLQVRFSRALTEVIIEKKLADQHVDPELAKRLLLNVDVKSLKVSGRGEEKESGFLEVFFSGYIFVMMMLFLVLTTGQLLVRSVVEEKSNRIVEVLLSSCSARELMMGKILGLSGLGLFQIAVWSLIGLAISLKVDLNFVLLENLFFSSIYLGLGYLFYAAIFVAAGSPVTTEQEAQQITSYLSLLLVFPIMIAAAVIQNPDSFVFRLLSYIPVFTPTLMIMRIAAQMPPLWEILATIGTLIVSTIGMMWVAGKIFRTAILVYGKRPTIPELFRWLRQA